MRPAWRRPLAAWRFTLPAAWRQPMVVWRTRVPDWQRRFPQWRRALPVAVPLLVGALGYLLLGNGPRSTATKATTQAPWALPAADAPDMAAAEALWTTRPPWGAAVAAQTAEAPVPTAAPLGVVMTRDGFRAVFALPGAIPFMVRPGDPLPGGGSVTEVSRAKVSWTDAAGTTQQRELLTDPAPPRSPGG